MDDFDFEQIDEFEGLEQDDWLMDINGVREEFDPETQKLLAQFWYWHKTPCRGLFLFYTMIIETTDYAT